MAKVIIKKALATNQETKAKIQDFRVIENGNIVLIFAEAEVVMPGNWRLSKDLCVGDTVAAYWDQDGRFHLEA